jgi:hypothetical protein
MHSHGTFIYYVLSHWIATMSGVISLSIALYQAFMKREIESRVYFIAAGLFIFVACDQVWQDEHRNNQLLISEKASLWSERDFWKQQSYSKDDSLRKKDDLLGKNYGVLAETQSSLATLSNRILDLAKERLKITDHYLGMMPSQSNTNIQAKYHGTFLVLTNKTITPIRLLVTCEGEIVQAGGMVLGTGAMMGGGWSGRVTGSKKQFGVGILSPAWTPVNPLLVTIYTNELDIGTCSFDEK